MAAATVAEDTDQEVVVKPNAVVAVRKRGVLEYSEREWRLQGQWK